MFIFSYLDAISSGTIAIFTVALFCVSVAQTRSSKASVEIANSLRAIEVQRDHRESPRVHICFDGYDPGTGEASFVMQNSGRRSLFLRSLKIHIESQNIDFFENDGAGKKDLARVAASEIYDIVISPDKTEKFRFKYVGGWGQNFELLAQTYSDKPVRIYYDGSRLAGYEYRVADGDMSAYFLGAKLDRDGRL